MQSWTQRLHWLQQQTQTLSSGRTLVEVVGKERVVIECHRGLRCYGTEQMRVKASFGEIRIGGCGLSLCCMSREQLCITGRIDTVELLGRSAGGALE